MEQYVLFIHSSDDGHLGHFHFAYYEHLCRKFLCDDMFSNLLLGVELLGSHLGNVS